MYFHNLAGTDWRLHEHTVHGTYVSNGTSTGDAHMLLLCYRKKIPVYSTRLTWSHDSRRKPIKWLQQFATWRQGQRQHHNQLLWWLCDDMIVWRLTCTHVKMPHALSVVFSLKQVTSDRQSAEETARRLGDQLTERDAKRWAISVN